MMRGKTYIHRVGEIKKWGNTIQDNVGDVRQNRDSEKEKNLKTETLRNNEGKLEIINL